MADKKRLLSGIKSTGQAHIGNYFGALRQFVALQDEYESFFMIADYHALTTSHLQRNPEKLREYIFDITLTYLAIGIDPDRATLFRQSDISEHTELAWVFNCITTMPYLMRAHAFKDAEAKDKEISVGTFDYPMLMAADILLYDADVVPVGQDQKQHLEFARDTAGKFNALYEDTFTLPEPHILDTVALVPGIDGQKMSKSYNNTIALFANRDEIAKAVMSIVTDSAGKRPEHVYAIHRLFKSEEELRALYESHTGNYKALKEALTEDIDAFVAPLRERRAAYEAEPKKVKEIIKKGGEKACLIASEKMRDVREKIGITV